MSEHTCENIHGTRSHIYACHITDIWNSQIHHPDLRYPIALCEDWNEDAPHTENRLTVDEAKELVRQLERAIVDSETGR